MSSATNTRPTPLVPLFQGQGPMPVRDYIAEALYASKHGYYTRRDLRRSDGRPGLPTERLAGIATLLAASFTRLVPHHSGARLVEQGPGEGRLMRHLLLALPPDVREGVTVAFIEPRLARRTRLLAVLQELGVGGTVVGSARDLDPAPSFVVAKEVLSSFPVHQLQRTGPGDEAWAEVHVRFADQGWSWEESLDTAPPHVRAFAQRHAGTTPVGHRYEANLQVEPWLGASSLVLDPGMIVIMDRARPLDPPAEGTLTAHLRGDPVDLYEAPGHAELSATVDLGCLRAAAHRVGLSEVSSSVGLDDVASPELATLVLGTSTL